MPNGSIKEIEKKPKPEQKKPSDNGADAVIKGIKRKNEPISAVAEANRGLI